MPIILPDPSGIAEGITRTGNTLADILNKVAVQRAGGLTPYQQISTVQRAREQQAKTERAVLNALNAFADPKKGTVLPKDIPSVYKDVMTRIRKGQNAADALNQGVRDYQYQSEVLKEIDVDKYSKGRGEELKETIIEKFKQNNIKNPTLIEATLKKKKWPARERRRIAMKMQGIDEPLSVKVEAKKESAKMPSPIDNEGKIIRDTKTGKRYKSDGKKWKEIK
jgi:hypothetical protein